MRTLNTPQEILRKGRTTLASAGGNRALPESVLIDVLLGSALIDIHSALELSFRDRLAHDERVPQETRTRVDSKDVKWRELITLMKSYGGLREEDGEKILWFNQIRNGIVHYGQTYRGTRQELDRYARLVDSLITGHQRSFDKAAMSNELYEASLATLGVASATKKPPDQGARAPARQQPSRTQVSQRQMAQPSRPGQRRREGDRLWVVMVVLVVIFVVWWIASHQGGSASVGVLAGVIAMSLAHVAGWFVMMLFL